MHAGNRLQRPAGARYALWRNNVDCKAWDIAISTRSTFQARAPMKVLAGARTAPLSTAALSPLLIRSKRVDKVETAEGRVVRWKANATGSVPMAQVCALQGIALVHVAPIACSSWVIGDSHDLAKNMMGLSNRVAAGGIPQVAVVDDQACRLSFTRDMAEGIFWLPGYREGDMEPSKPVPYGAYNLTGSGQPKG